jgi:hypothetical protein
VTEFANDPFERAAGVCPATNGREVRVVQVIAARGVPARATALGAAPAPRAPRARAGARSHRTLATRAGAKISANSPAAERDRGIVRRLAASIVTIITPSPRVRTWLLTASAISA